MGISKNPNSVIDGTTSQSTKPASWQVAGYPAKAGIQRFYQKMPLCQRVALCLYFCWTPAFAGVTNILEAP
jgi:hypothetical protein